MTDLRTQRRMAAQLLKCGRNRVWMDWRSWEDIAVAVTRGEIRKLIASGAIKAAQKRGISRARINYKQGQRRKGRRRGYGKRRGTKNARYPRKRQWINTIRPIRRTLRELRDTGKIDRHTYRLLYRQAKGGMFKSTSHLLHQIESRGLYKQG